MVILQKCFFILPFQRTKENAIKSSNIDHWYFTSPTLGIEAIAGLIPIYLYLDKINRRKQLRTASLLLNYAFNSLLEN